MTTTPPSGIDRRSFLKLAAVGAAAVSLAPSLTAAEPVRRRGIKLGLDNFSVRGMKWKADALIDYAVKLRTDSLFITDLDAFESFDEPYLVGLRKKAADQGLQIHLCTLSICPTSKAFKKNWGTAEEHLALAIRVAKALGSPVARAVLGTGDDRKTPGGIHARIADTVKVCKACRSQAVDAGIKIAIENHAGDMQARELVTLVEAAGKDYVAVNLDSGNAVWTIEDPITSLEILAPYVATTSLRDSSIWTTPDGCAMQWVAMGEGVVDLIAYFDAFEKLCPGIPVHIETIGGFNRDLPFLKPEFMALWPDYSAIEFAKFVALTRKGKPLQAGRGSFATDQEFQRDQIERSLVYCKETLGLGLKA
jgi:sugar phosphate isomerase/epimerase